MSKLHDYLKSAGVTQEAFAERLGVKQPTVSRLVRGASGLSLDLAIRIEDATGGAVPAASWTREKPE